MVKLTWDEAKRRETLRQRNIDFALASEVFAGPVFDKTDIRFKYSEARIVTFGLLRGRLVCVVWTPLGEVRHVISMRKCNAREQRKFRARLRSV